MRMSIVLGIVMFFICMPFRAHAHIAGQPPFFTINGVYADFYPISVTSLPTFPLPQDRSPESYVINQSLSFTIDTKRLPFPDEVIQQSTFTWDFGDGEIGEGLTNTHSYTKPGSYLLTIKADYGDYADVNTKPIIQSILLHILPNKSYVLPQAVITINHNTVESPDMDSIVVKYDEPVSFSASSSKQGSSPIAQYIWDLGNGIEKNDESFFYSYRMTDQVYLFPFLRIIDSQGFISDTYVQLERQKGTTPTSSFYISPLFIILVLINLGIISGIILLVKRR